MSPPFFCLKTLTGENFLSALRREEELEKEMERAAAVKIPVVAKDEDGNGSLKSVPLLNPTAGDSSSTLN